MCLKNGPMKPTLPFVIAIAIAASGTQLTAQVQTNVPEVVAGAKPETVEHIKVHGISASKAHAAESSRPIGEI